jgi:hypothetical protein
MSGEGKCTSPGAYPVKRQRKAISMEEKLDVIHKLHKGQRTAKYLPCS